MPHEPSSAAAVCEAINAVHSAREAWTQTGLPERQQLMHSCMQCLRDNACDIATENVARKGSAGSGIGEELCASSAL